MIGMLFGKDQLLSSKKKRCIDSFYNKVNRTIEKARVFRPNISIVSYPAKQIRIEFDTRNSFSWPEIDAVQVLSNGV